MMQFVTYVPVRFNDGSPVPKSDLMSIVNRFCEKFGGASVVGPVQGHWIDGDSGLSYSDESLRIEVACSNDQYAEAEEFVLQIGREFQQEAMYFEVRYFDGVRILKVPPGD